MYLGSFETAYLQREVPEDVVVKSDSHLVVGQMVKLANHTITTLSAGTVPAARDEATHIVAQSDMTMEYGHVPVENRDYKYSDEVAATIAAAGPVAASTPTKKVALFAITDKDDLIVKTVA